MSTPVLTRIAAVLGRLAAAKPVRASIIAAAAVLLAATLGFLYYKTQGVALKRYNDALVMLLRRERQR